MTGRSLLIVGYYSDTLAPLDELGVASINEIAPETLAPCPALHLPIHLLCFSHSQQRKRVCGLAHGNTCAVSRVVVESCVHSPGLPRGCVGGLPHDVSRIYDVWICETYFLICVS